MAGGTSTGPGWSKRRDIWWVLYGEREKENKMSVHCSTEFMINVLVSARHSLQKHTPCLTCAVII